jgi:hypothetical protein
MDTEKSELILSVDYGQSWPLSDIFWDDRPDWPKLLQPELVVRLEAWASFFREHADDESGLFGSEEKRRWFDLEAFALRDALEQQVGDRYAIRIELWF